MTSIVDDEGTELHLECGFGPGSENRCQPTCTALAKSSQDGLIESVDGGLRREPPDMKASDQGRIPTTCPKLGDKTKAIGDRP